VDGLMARLGSKLENRRHQVQNFRSVAQSGAGDPQILRTCPQIRVQHVAGESR
jgi:hypothetical protein